MDRASADPGSITSLDSNSARERLPDESFAYFELGSEDQAQTPRHGGNTHDLIRSLRNKAITAEKRRKNNLQFHHCQITTYASPTSNIVSTMDLRTMRYRSPWTIGERVECLVDNMLVTLEPALGSVDFDILTPDVDITVDRVGRHADNSTFNKVLAHHRQTAFRNNARKAKRRGRVDTKPLVDACIEVRQAFDLINGSDQLAFRSKLLVEFLLKFLHDMGIGGKVIYDSAESTRIA